MGNDINIVYDLDYGKEHEARIAVMYKQEHFLLYGIIEDSSFLEGVLEIHKGVIVVSNLKRDEQRLRALLKEKILAKVRGHEIN